MSIEWRKSNRSNTTGGECVEVARLTGDTVGVRDSKDPEGPQLGITPAAARGLAEVLRAGE
ncbi:DUF397 domain-containing protein [Actinomadura harenae]|uniref:DUF397 domain-containing protein n=1 Tax=Actinomadura harenae TaxID=2483351 RepID=A0A3M2M1V2_9ACTN|nr:DUF397 domain-containing protein [Actinomadura harenae]RMI42425.1 DUF397 domain-containing protein [Actinomadura harenae]